MLPTLMLTLALTAPSGAPAPKATTSAASWRAKRPSVPPAKPPVLPVFQRMQLANGLTLLLAEAHHLPIVSFSLVTRGGAAMDPDGKAGLTALLYAMLEEGAGPYSALAFSDEVAKLGASFSSGAADAMGAVSIRGLSRVKAPMLNLLKIAVQSPTLKEADFMRRQSERRARLTGQEASLGGQLSLKLPGLLFGPKHPLGHPSSGTAQSVGALAYADLKAQYTRVMDPKQSALVVVGDLSAEELRDLAETHFGSWTAKGDPRPSLAPVPSQRRRVVHLIDKRPAPGTLVVIGRPLFGKGHPDELALEIANHIFGGMFSSRLNMNLREDKGYTYGAHSRLSLGKGVGSFLAYAMVKADQTVPSVHEFFHELEGLKSRPFSETEVNQAKDSIIRSLTGSFETLGAASQAATQLFIDDLDLDYYRNLGERIRQTPKDAVNNAAEVYLAPSQMLLILIGDSKGYQKPLQKLKLGTLKPVS